MCQIVLSIPDEVLYDTKMSHEQVNQFARQAVALGYYTQSGVSIGYWILLSDCRYDRERIYQIFRSKSYISLPV